MSKTKNKNKNKEILSDIGQFQAEFGENIVPIQRFFMYVGVILMIIIGIAVIVYGETASGFDEQARHMFLGVGIAILIFAVIGFTLAYVWTSFAKTNKTIAQINAFEFEANLLKGIF